MSLLWYKQLMLKSEPLKLSGKYDQLTLQNVPSPVMLSLSMYSYMSKTEVTQSINIIQTAETL